MLTRLAVLLLATAALLAIPPGPAVAEEQVAVSLHAPFAISADPASVAAGSVNFQVSNDDLTIHNFRVIATDLAPDALPVDPMTNTVIEAQLNVVASTDDVPAGQSAKALADLPAGNYVLICNVPGHYSAGQRLGFQITGGPKLSGDVDGNGDVNAVDALLVLRFVAGLQSLPNMAVGDVNCDGFADATDALLILRHVAGLPVVLPEGCLAISTPVA